MTTFDWVTENCDACGAPAETQVVTSSTTFGAPDLDTRPAEMLRSTLEFEITRCTECDYCWEPGTESSAQPDALKTLIVSEPYLAALATKAPEPAPAFLARSIADAELGDFAQAGWSALKAAWVCDDAGDVPQARAARNIALRYWSQATAAGQRFCVDDGGDVLVRADLLRRVGEINEAIFFIDAHAAGVEDEDLAVILQYIRTLCCASDDSVHTVSEAFADA